MKNILTIIFILIYGALNAQSIVNFKFYDNCTDSVVNLDYDISKLDDNFNSISVKDSTMINYDGAYIITVYRKQGDYYASYDFTKELLTTENYCDTIELPKITVWFGTALNSQYMKFHYCDKVCNGHVIDYYKTGQKWIEGEFVDGMPKNRIKYYDKNGDLIKIGIYNRKGLKRYKFPNYKSYLKSN